MDFFTDGTCLSQPVIFLAVSWSSPLGLVGALRSLLLHHYSSLGVGHITHFWGANLKAAFIPIRRDLCSRLLW